MTVTPKSFADSFLIGPNLTIGELNTHLNDGMPKPLVGGNPPANPLNRAKRRLSGIPESELLAILKLFGRKCLWCGEFGFVTMDHVVPRSLGGSHCRTNLQPLCATCNGCKGSKIMDFRPLCDIAELERQIANLSAPSEKGIVSHENSSETLTESEQDLEDLCVRNDERVDREEE